MEETLASQIMVNIDLINFPEAISFKISNRILKVDEKILKNNYKEKL